MLKLYKFEHKKEEEKLAKVVLVCKLYISVNIK